MKEIYNYTNRNNNFLQRKLQWLWRTAMVIVAVFLIMTSSHAQTVRSVFGLPAAERCTSEDLDIVDADLALNNCDCVEGQTVYGTLTLGVMNNTESLRTSYAFWGRLVMSDDDPQTNDIVYYINGCEPTIPPGSQLPDRTKLASFDDLKIYTLNAQGQLVPVASTPSNIGKIPYVCGTELKITNIYQAWTDASKNDNRTCPLDPSKINPKCDVIPVIEVGVGLTAESAKTDISCNNASDGSAIITFSGGTAPYFLSWDGGAYTQVTSPVTKTNLTAKVYNWSVKDSSTPACEKTGSITISNPAALSLAIASTGISCNGSTDGIIALDGSANPANSAFDSYKLYKVVGSRDGAGNTETNDQDLGAVSPNASGVLKTGLGAGTYYVIGTKASATQASVNCTAGSDAETISEPAALSLAIASTGISCNGSADGIISLDGAANPANSAFDSYKLYKVVGSRDGAGNTETNDQDLGAVTPNASGVLKTGLGAGSYYVIGTKASSAQATINCSAGSDTETISNPAALSLAISSTGISCNGATDGIISLDGSANNSAFDSYELYKVVGSRDGVGNSETNDADLGAVTPDANGILKTGLGAGTYYVIGTKASVTQASVNCTAGSDAETISEPAALSLAITSTNITCSSGGILSLNASANPANSVFDSYVLWKVVGNQDGVGNTETNDVSQGTVSPDANGVLATGLGVGSYYVIGAKASATQPSVNCTAKSNVRTFTQPSCISPHLFPTATTCENYLCGNIESFQLRQLCVTLSKGNPSSRTITNAIPGAMFYYGDYTPTSSGTVTIWVDQTAPSGYSGLNPQNEANVRVYSANCGNISYTPYIDGRDASVTFFAEAGVKYVISVKYDPKSIIGSPAPSTNPVTKYSFVMKLGADLGSATAIDGSAGEVAIVAGCSDTTPPASGSCTSNLTATSTSALEGIMSDEMKAYPTPFSDKATIEFTTSRTENFVVNLYDMKGALVRQLKAGTAKAGELQVVEVDGAGLNEGLYIARMTSDSGAKAVKLLLKRD